MQKYSVRPEDESETLLVSGAADEPVTEPVRAEEPAPEKEPVRAQKKTRPPEPDPEPAPRPTPLDERRRVLAKKIRKGRRFPFLQLFGYYLGLIIVIAALLAFLPAVQRMFINPVVLPAITEGAELFRTGRVPGAAPAVEMTLEQSVERALTTLLMTLGSLALVLPVAWVYMFTKRLQYDPSLVQSVIILPVVVTGILLIVKNSLALAFSLAGIVAAVRFRNTLKDPKDAVYIFLALGIGIASGVTALDVGVIMSLSFNVVVLLLWKYNVGSTYTGWHGGTTTFWALGAPGSNGKNQFISVGDPTLTVAQEPEKRRELKKRLGQLVDGMKTDGILLVHSAEVDLARDAVEDALGDLTRGWKLAEITPGEGGNSTLEYLLRLKKKRSAGDLLGALDERWASHVAAAEYVPFKNR